MSRYDAFKLPLKSMSVGVHEFDYKLDTNWFTMIDGPEVQRGDVQAKVRVRNTGLVYEIEFSLEGTVMVPCDRCLEDMPLPISETSHLIAKFGAEYSDEGEDVIIVPETEGELNIAWFLYEIIALAVPLKHVHQPGKCSKAMSSKLRKHLAKSIDDEDSDILPEDDDLDEDEADDENTQTNPIWDGLKDWKETE